MLTSLERTAFRNRTSVHVREYDPARAPAIWSIPQAGEGKSSGRGEGVFGNALLDAGRGPGEGEGNIPGAGSAALPISA